MQLLSSYLCAATPLHRLPVRSISSTLFGPASSFSCSKVELFATRWRGDRTRLHAQSQEGVDSETVNVTDLRDAEPEPNEVEPPSYPYVAGLSEDEIREALLFEEGGDDEGPRLEEAARMGEGDDAGSGLGFERTIPIPINKGNGEIVARMLSVFKGLLDRPFGSGASVAAAGSAVIERVQEEIETLTQEDQVNEQLLFEVIRVTRLLEMDMKLIGAAQKESTLLERLDSARNHCQEAILLANAL